MTLKISEHVKNDFELTLAFAEKIGRRKQLDDILAYLRTYADHEENGRCEVELGWDFAPYSYSVQWRLRGENGEYRDWMRGGLIFHRAWKDGARVDDDGEWSVHT